MTILPLRNSVNHAPSRRGFLLIPLALAVALLALPHSAKAADGAVGDGTSTAEGTNALKSLATGTDDTACGFNALASNTSGNENTATGAFALVHNTTGNDNTATGLNALFFNMAGADNTAIGVFALGSNESGNINTAAGFNALASNDSGTANTATGGQALNKNTTGIDNTATGVDALFSNTSGSFNTATGLSALSSNSIGHDNTAQGFLALQRSTGSNNIALGSNAGANLTSGSNNIDIGNVGVAGETAKIRIGKQGTQNGTFIAGIFGVPVTGSTVVVNSTGKLGVATSSARFKEAIKPMDKASEAILALKPVTFRYKQELDPDGIPQFGLVAEQVEKVNPDLVVRDENGKVNTVRYDAVNAMLLNEFLKEHRNVAEQQSTIAELKTTVAQQQKQIEALTATVQKVSDQVALSKPALQLGANP